MPHPLIRLARTVIISARSILGSRRSVPEPDRVVHAGGEPASHGRSDQPLLLVFAQGRGAEEKLETHLSLLKDLGVIADWHDRRIAAGTEWDGVINENLDRAGIILLLVSADFLASRYCRDVEVARAMERHEAGTARVIPIILRPVDWHSAPFGKLQALPRDGKPVTKWRPQDEAFTDIARGIREAAKSLATDGPNPPAPARPSPGAATSAPGPTGPIDRATLVRTVSGLAPSDMAMLLTLIEGAARHVSRHGTVPEQAAELIRWAESSTGPGLEAIRRALENFSSGPLTGKSGAAAGKSNEAGGWRLGPDQSHQLIDGEVPTRGMEFPLVSPPLNEQRLPRSLPAPIRQASLDGSQDASALLFILQHHTDGLPYEVIAAALRWNADKFKNLLERYLDEEAYRLRHECKPAKEARDLILRGDGDTLLARTLEELLAYLKQHKSDGLGIRYVEWALILATKCKDSNPRIVRELFNSTERMLKLRGDKHRVLRASRLTIEAARQQIRDWEGVKAEAVALICGESWVLQRIGRLDEAMLRADESLKLGESIQWERNTAFCKKCKGRVYRLMGELERDGEKKARFFSQSVSSLKEAIRIFSGMTDWGADCAEVGDCYSLLARTYLVCNQLADARKCLKHASDRLNNPDDKDYLDYTILEGDYACSIGEYDKADEFYGYVIESQCTGNFEKSEIRRVRVLPSRVIRGEAESQIASRRDFLKAGEIWDDLEERANAAEARWHLTLLGGGLSAKTIRVPGTGRLHDEDDCCRDSQQPSRETHHQGFTTLGAGRQILEGSHPGSSAGGCDAGTNVVKRRRVSRTPDWTSAASRRLREMAGGVSTVSDAVITVAARYTNGLEGPPTDLEAVGKRLNILRTEAEALPISGELRRAASGFIIVYSTYLSATRRRFTIAHELAHAIFEQSGPKCPRSGKELERLCDMLATELLMPRREFLREAGKPDDLSWSKIDDLSRMFRTSLSATSLRCAELLGVTIFEVEDDSITWAYGSIRKGPVAKLHKDIRFAIEKTRRREPIDEKIVADADLGGYREWKIEGRLIGQDGRALMLMLPGRGLLPKN